jgi:hypothetical protein
MYLNMQTMRGMGWMWRPPLQAQQALSESSSAGAQLVRSDSACFRVYRGLSRNTDKQLL